MEYKERLLLDALDSAVNMQRKLLFVLREFMDTGAKDVGCGTEKSQEECKGEGVLKGGLIPYVPPYMPNSGDITPNAGTTTAKDDELLLKALQKQNYGFDVEEAAASAARLQDPTDIPFTDIPF